MFRQIVTPQDTKLILQLPAEFVGRFVEIIAFPVDAVESDNRKLGNERHSQQERLLRLRKFISKNPVILPVGYKFNRDDLYE
ncbi:MAG: hypothetical protein EPN85_07395 [Bacteroidetes bacterium]|nr:MAG: hypothetical protein EPN85_07395 [Bacteroidota bacterium]